MSRRAGFTIIEVLLFLAVSGLLLAVAMATIGSSIRTTRFADSTKSLQSFLQAQYTEVQSGVAERDSKSSCDSSNAAPGASNNCVVIGQLLDINGDTIRKYTVVANVTDSNPCAADSGSTKVSYQIERYCPRTLDYDGPAAQAASEVYKLEWGVSTDKMKYLHNDGTVGNFNKIAILRSPTSEAMYIYTYNDPRSAGPNFYLNGSRTSSDGYTMNKNLNQPAVICLKSPDIIGASRSYIEFTGGQGADVIKSGTDTSLIENQEINKC